MSLSTTEQLENNIVAFLDDELDDSTNTVISREVMRNPQARQMLDEYRENDELCRQALEALMNQGKPQPQTKSADPIPLHGRAPAWRWVGWSSAAASIAFVMWGAYMAATGPMGAFLPFQDPTQGPEGPGTVMAAGLNDSTHRDAPMARLIERHQPAPANQPVVYAQDEYDYGDTLEADTDKDSNTERYFFGLHDETNNKFYWLETQQATDEYEVIEADL